MLNERKHWVAAVSHGRPEVRITMTYPVIESSRRVAFLVAGKGKAAIFSAIRAGASQVPAARVKPVIARLRRGDEGTCRLVHRHVAFRREKGDVPSTTPTHRAASQFRKSARLRQKLCQPYFAMT